jgi:hypothetical protein
MMVSVKRWYRRDVLAALGLGIAAIVAYQAMAQSTGPADFVQVGDGKLMLSGKPFVVKGTNYFGSWRYHYTVKQPDGIERGNIWDFYHEWDTHKIALDFQFIYSQLHATAVRIGTPSLLDFENLVKYSGYESWFNSDGTITDRYKDELVQLADVAYANGIRIQLCLLWSLRQEIAKDGDAFTPGAKLDRFYSNYVRSVGLAVRDHPGIMSFSVGNEVLVYWPINGRERSWYEPRAGGFILRRLNDVRTAAPMQLVATDENAAPGARTWHDPGPDLAVLPDIDNSNGGKPFRLADRIDYLAPHFYPETLTPQDLNGGFVRKIEDSKDKLKQYIQAANAIRKPVAIGEFGLKRMPLTLSPEQYSAVRDRFFEGFLAKGEELGLQGLLVWAGLPGVILKEGHYIVKESKANPFSPTEVDVEDADGGSRRILFYDASYPLFVWRNDSGEPIPTPAAKALASAWPHIPQLKRSSPDALH